MNPEVQHAQFVDQQMDQAENEVDLALRLARQRYGKNLEVAMPPPAQMDSKRLRQLGHKVHPQHAFNSGKENKRQGAMRVSPYYEAPKSDHFWFAGYDGKTMQEAIATQ